MLYKHWRLLLLLLIIVIDSVSNKALTQVALDTGLSRCHLSIALRQSFPQPHVFHLRPHPPSLPWSLPGPERAPEAELMQRGRVGTHTSLCDSGPITPALSPEHSCPKPWPTCTGPWVTLRRIKDQHYCHWGPGNPSLGRAFLCITTCLPASLTSSH